jgi:mannitol/fructose-specific phosphotransferase system IIA component (Ntr-type)
LGGHVEYDHQSDYVSNFNIECIYYKDRKIHHKKILEFLMDKLYDDESFRERIEEIAKSDRLM